MIDTGFPCDAGGSPSRRHHVPARRQRHTPARRDGSAAHRAAGRSAMPVAGLWSTADDYLRFIEMLFARGGTVNGGPGAVSGIGTADDAQPIGSPTSRSGTTSSDRRSGSAAVSGSTCRWSPIRRNRPALFGPGGLGTFSWPGAVRGTWWQADPACRPDPALT